MNKKSDGLHSENSTGTTGEAALKNILGERWHQCSGDLGDGKIDYNNKEYYYELKSSTKKFSETIKLNQIRAIKCIPVIIYSQTDNKWALVSPQDIMSAASKKKRGQHSELFIENCGLSNKNFDLKIIESNELISELEKMFILVETDTVKKLIKKSEEIKERLQKLNESLKKEIEEVLNGS